MNFLNLIKYKENFDIELELWTVSTEGIFEPKTIIKSRPFAYLNNFSPNLI